MPSVTASGKGSHNALGRRRLQRWRRVRPAVLQAHRLREIGEEGHFSALQTKASKSGPWSKRTRATQNNVLTLAPPVGRILLRRSLHPRGCQAHAGRGGLLAVGEPAAVQGLLLHEPQLHDLTDAALRQNR